MFENCAPEPHDLRLVWGNALWCSCKAWGAPRALRALGGTCRAQPSEHGRPIKGLRRAERAAFGGNPFEGLGAPWPK
jgi:hypothetical protein